MPSVTGPHARLSTPSKPAPGESGSLDAVVGAELDEG